MADADRVGSLVDNPNKDELVQLVLHNLAQLHTPHGMTYDRLQELYTVTYKAYSWSHDPTTAGAFALFGPDQFSNFYPYLSRPAAYSKLHIAGEAASAHHAWVAGALDSAYNAVYRFLLRFKLWDAIGTLEKRTGQIRRARVWTKRDCTLASDVRLASEDRAS
ncbi:hypothetical protein F4860DRAFT_518476 [Xylaria cubensis]|nr:hypothetical protein F4860DRAFT_518476 [Xylaria cubensis]